MLKETPKCIPERLPALTIFTKEEEKEMEKNRFNKDRKGNWRMKDGKQI